LLLESIEETVRGVLGELPVQALYDALEKKEQIKRDDIPQRLEDFQNALPRLLGAGSPVIIRMMTRNLYRKFEIPYRQETGYDLKKHVEICRQIYMKKKLHA
jgi:hypothetical protein